LTTNATVIIVAPSFVIICILAPGQAVDFIVTSLSEIP
jgi:hypothetical protein